VACAPKVGELRFSSGLFLLLCHAIWAILRCKMRHSACQIGRFAMQSDLDGGKTALILFVNFIFIVFHFLFAGLQRYAFL